MESICTEDDLLAQLKACVDQRIVVQRLKTLPEEEDHVTGSGLFALFVKIDWDPGHLHLQG